MIAASPGSIFHFPSWSYKHTRSTQLVHMDITIRNWNPKHGFVKVTELVIRLERAPEWKEHSQVANEINDKGKGDNIRVERAPQGQWRDLRGYGWGWPPPQSFQKKSQFYSSIS